jgi:predicted MPP superfamily phosphohydrolase
MILGALSYFNLSPFMKRFVLGAVICVGIAKLFTVSFLVIDDVIRLFRYIAAKASSSAAGPGAAIAISRSEFLTRGALIAGGAIFGLFSWGMIRTAYHYKVRRVTMKFPQLPESFKGLKIVQISDAHVGSFLGPEPIFKAVELINEQKPDIVFFTGDLVNSVATEAENFIEAFSGIRAKHGVYSTLGNHDYGGYYNWDSEEAAENNMKRLYAIHKECGWTLLNNENRILDIDGANIAVIGVENWGASRHFPKRGDIDKAKIGTELADLRLLLSHDPTHWDDIVSQKHPEIDMTFSGHTHGFQMGIEVPWLKLKWSPAQYAYKHWAGLYQQGKQYLYVNRGIGFIGYHGRVGILPEITLMEISRS